MMGQPKRNPLGCGSGEGAQDTTSSPYSSAILEAVDAVCSAFNTNRLPAQAGWRDGLAQGSPRFRNFEHKTYESGDGRAARRKLARMLAKKGVKP